MMTEKRQKNDSRPFQIGRYETVVGRLKAK